MKRPEKLKNPLFALLLLLLSVLLLTVGSYAAYTTSAYVKQVIRARTQDGNENLRFSSNLLYSYALTVDAYEERSISVSGSGEVVIGINICNYPQGILASYNDKNISYTMTVIGPNGSNFTFSPESGELQGGKPSLVPHIIKIPAESVSAVSGGYLTVVVTPDEASTEATNQKKLAAKLKIVPQEATASGWQGELQFEGASSDNDAINYFIFGTRECDMVLSWGPKIKLGQWSREALNVISSTENSVTIHVGGPGQPTSYYLQFYRLEPAASDETAESLGISFAEQS